MSGFPGFPNAATRADTPRLGRRCAAAPGMRAAAGRVGRVKGLRHGGSGQPRGAARWPLWAWTASPPGFQGVPESWLMGGPGTACLQRVGAPRGQQCGPGRRSAFQGRVGLGQHVCGEPGLRNVGGRWKCAQVAVLSWRARCAWVRFVACGCVTLAWGARCVSFSAGWGRATASVRVVLALSGVVCVQQSWP